MEKRDFFVSYAGPNSDWAEWITMQLKFHGYSVYCGTFDIHAGVDFVKWMDEALRSSDSYIVLWSESYARSKYCQIELDAIYSLVKKRTHHLFLIRVSDYRIDNILLAPYIRLDLFRSTEDDAVSRLLSFVGYNGSIQHLCPFPNHTDSSPNFDRRYFEEYSNNLLKSFDLGKLDTINSNVNKILSLLMNNPGNVTNIRTEHFHTTGFDASGEVNISIRNMENVTAEGGEHGSPMQYINDVSSAMIREIYHLCKTPLATIKIALSNFSEIDSKSLTDDQLQCLNDISNDVLLVNLIISEYRQLVMDAPVKEISAASENIETLLNIILDSACRSNNKVITGRIDSFPNNTSIHGNFFVTMLCKPLIDNAVEAAPDRTEIVIRCYESEDDTAIVIENECENSVPDDQDLQNNGFTTKANDCEGNPGGGIGLSGIRHVAVNQGIGFEIHSDNNKRKVIATLRFPKK